MNLSRLHQNGVRLSVYHDWDDYCLIIFSVGLAMHINIFSVSKSWENEVISIFLPCECTLEQDLRLWVTLQVFVVPYIWKRYLFIDLDFFFNLGLTSTSAGKLPGRKSIFTAVLSTSTGRAIDSQSSFFFSFCFCLIMLPQGLNKDHAWICSFLYYITDLFLTSDLQK